MDETIENLRRQRLVLLREIEVKQQQVQGFGDRIRAMLMDTIDELSSDGVDMGKLGKLVEKTATAAAPVETRKIGRPRGLAAKRYPDLPHGAWRYIIHKFLVEKKAMRVTADEIIEWIGVPSLRREAVYQNMQNAACLKALSESRWDDPSRRGVYVVRENWPLAEIEKIVAEFESKEGIGMDQIREILNRGTKTPAPEATTTPRDNEEGSRPDVGESH